MEIRRLGPEDGDVVRKLATRPPHFELLEDERTVFLAAFEDGEPIGFAFGYVLRRRHGASTILFVYEIEVNEGYRRGGIGKELMRALAREAGAADGFVLTEPDNEEANALYASLGGERSDVIQWDFEYAEP